MNRRTYLAMTCGITGGLGGCLRQLNETREDGTVTCGETTHEPQSDGTVQGTDPRWQTVFGDARNTGSRPSTDGPEACPTTRWHAAPDHPLDSVDNSFDFPPTVADELLFIVSNDILYTIAAETGSLEWTANLDGVLRPPVIVGDTAVLGSSTGIHAVSIDDGSQLWHTETPAAVKAGMKASDGMFFATSRKGHVFGLTENGDIRWTERIGASGGDDGEFLGTPAVADGRLIVGGIDGTAAAFDTESGDRVWERAFEGNAIPAPVVGDDFAYLADYAGLHAVDPETGTDQWQAFETVVGSPALADGTLFVQAGDSREELYLVALDAETGDEQWQTPIALPESSPTVGRSAVYLGVGANLVAIDRETHDITWEMDPGSGDIHSHAVLLDGTIYICGVQTGVFAVA